MSFMIPGMLARSYLFVPGHRPDRFAKALSSGADAVILDLEDAVGPGDKQAAREAVADWLNPATPVVVRVNGPGTPWFAEDVRVCQHPGVSAVSVPKVERPGDLEAVREHLRGKPLLPFIESAASLSRAADIGRVADVQRLIFGALDFQVDLDIPDDDEGLRRFRSELVFASRLAGIAAPVDGVTTNFKDPAMVSSDAARARRLGFGAKLCIHPSQVAIVNAAFSPTEADIVWARSVVEADAASAGSATAAGGQMIDRPVLIRAQRILEHVEWTRRRTEPSGA